MHQYIYTFALECFSVLNISQSEIMYLLFLFECVSVLSDIPQSETEMYVEGNNHVTCAVNMRQQTCAVNVRAQSGMFMAASPASSGACPSPVCWSDESAGSPEVGQEQSEIDAIASIAFSLMADTRSSSTDLDRWSPEPEGEAWTECWDSRPECLIGDSLDIVRGDALRGNSLRGDSLRGDPLTGDALRGDSLRGDSLGYSPALLNLKQEPNTDDWCMDSCNTYTPLVSVKQPPSKQPLSKQPPSYTEHLLRQQSLEQKPLLTPMSQQSMQDKLTSETCQFTSQSQPSHEIKPHLSSPWPFTDTCTNVDQMSYVDPLQQPFYLQSGHNNSLSHDSGEKR